MGKRMRDEGREVKGEKLTTLCLLLFTYYSISLRPAHFFHGFIKPIRQCDLWFETESFHDLLRGTDGAVNVASARLSMDMFRRIREEFVENIKQVEQAGFHTGTDVEDLSRCGWMLGREQVGLHNIAYVDQVTALAAIAIDGNGFVIQHTADKDRNGGGIHGIRSLARTVDIEIAECSHFKAKIIGK